MTKEEVLHKHLGYHWENQIHTVYYNAMEEYAKQECIEFYMWSNNLSKNKAEQDFEVYQSYKQKLQSKQIQ